MTDGGQITETRGHPLTSVVYWPIIHSSYIAHDSDYRAVFYQSLFVGWAAKEMGCQVKAIMLNNHTDRKLLGEGHAQD